MNLSNEVPSEVRQIVADKEKRQEFYRIIGLGSGTIEIGGKHFHIEPSFNGFTREHAAEVSKLPIGKNKS